MADGPSVLIVCGDLFFSTQLKSSAESSGAAVEVELSPARLAERIAGGQYSHVVVDLEASGLDVSTLIESLPAEGRPVVIAFGPHVQSERLEGAREAGCDRVVSRGQIASSLGSLIAG